MEVSKFKSVKMSLMKTQGDVNEENSKADYLVKGSATFDITPEFYEELIKEERKDLTKGLIAAMFEELNQSVDDVDTVGLWVDYDEKVFENAIRIDTLGDMEKFGAEGITPIYEFFNLTIGETED